MSLVRPSVRRVRGARPRDLDDAPWGRFSRGVKLELGTILKTGATAAFQIASRAVGFGALGLGLNIVLAMGLGPAIWGLTEVSGGSMGGHGGGAIGVVLLAIVYWKSLLALAVLLVGFPVAWFMVGQKHGIQVAIRHIVAERKAFLVEYLIRRLAAKLQTPAMAERINQSGLRKALNEMLPGYLAKLDNMPWSLRKLFRWVVSRLDFQGFLLGIVDEKQLRTVDADVLCDAASEKANQLIDEKLLSASPTLLWGLAGVNAGVVVAIAVLGG